MEKEVLVKKQEQCAYYRKSMVILFSIKDKTLIQLKEITKKSQLVY